jgi:orotate phosphoribosyltransferase
MNPSDAAALARDLLRVGAVALQPAVPFTWASGLRSPIYCDNRVTLAFPEVRERIAAALVATIGELGPAPDAVAGVATAGIPQATLVADRLGLPLAYVRAQAKEHGRQNRIEGRIDPGQRVVMVEDLVSTGGSSLTAVEAVREAGAVVTAVIAVFTYGLPAADRAFAASDVPLRALVDLETLLAQAAAGGMLDAAEIDVVRRWRQDPQGWQEAAGR